MMRLPQLVLVLVLFSLRLPLNAQVPEWLDTIAPVVSITPVQRWHKSLILVDFAINEPGKIWVRHSGATQFERYTKPISFSLDGRYTIHYYADDDFGNQSTIDSVVYILDTQAPHIQLSPAPGRFRSPQQLQLGANEHCRFYLRPAIGDTALQELSATSTIRDSLVGALIAIDSAGNMTSTGKISYHVDSVTIQALLSPRGGLYNKPQRFELALNGSGEAYYSFDPLAPSKWFVKYEGPRQLPYGMTVVRYYGRDERGWQSEIKQATFVIDTIAPTLRLQHREGSTTDTLTLLTREAAMIRYSLSGLPPGDSGLLYQTPLLIPRTGHVSLMAVARDSAGNTSSLLKWHFRYDTIPPALRFVQKGGGYQKESMRLTMQTSEPARIFYTIDGSEAGPASLLYGDGIALSRQGQTIIRARAMDDAGNISSEVVDTFILDNVAPLIKAGIEGNVQDSSFVITLSSNEPATIYYELANREPDASSPLYTQPLILRAGQTLRYYALDKNGNKTAVEVLNELDKPVVTAVPPGGMYNRRLAIAFLASKAAQVMYRVLPDTLFSLSRDSLVFESSGVHTLEYFSRSLSGLTSPVRRDEYVIDALAPVVDITVGRGMGDTAIISFEANENASIYYTYDGTNPQFSRTARIVGNKFLSSRGRIKIKRTADVKLAFYAEDAAGNQSMVSVLDVFKPRAVPNIPDGPQRLYDRILSISFSTYDQSVVYFSRHGSIPTIDSSIYRSPITLTASDTICAFVIDASGFVGEVDTFIYMIDLPPSPRLTITPAQDSILARRMVFFDASATIDNETPAQQLLYRWDYDGNGTFDTPWSASSRSSHRFVAAGLYTVTMEVKDNAGRVARVQQPLRVRDLCLPGMVFIVDKSGSSFCIDRYEWPNMAGQTPSVELSWVEAKMYCMEVGKRLCTAREWESACRGFSMLLYPYGSTYEESRCATQGGQSFAAGSFKRCGEGFGLFDMIGNVWEWVADKQGDYPLVMGGAYTSGKDAHCGVHSVGAMATKSKSVGFRCCK